MYYGWFANCRIKKSGLNTAFLIITPFYDLIFSAIIAPNGPRFLMFRPSCPSLKIWISGRDVECVWPDSLKTKFLLIR
jgi:hypothetical protein